MRCGVVSSTANDMAKWMSLFFRDNITAGASPEQIFDGTTIREWLAHRTYTNPMTVGVDSLKPLHWGNVWEVRTRICCRSATVTQLTA